MSRRLRPAADSGEFGAIRRLFLQRLGQRGRELHAVHVVRRASREVRALSDAAKPAVFGSTLKGEGIVRSDDITADPRYGHNPPYHGLYWSIRTHRCSAGTRTQDRHLKSNRPSAM